MLLGTGMWDCWSMLMIYDDDDDDDLWWWWSMMVMMIAMDSYYDGYL